MSTILDSIAAVREAISNKKPFCTGTYPLSENAGLLFFRGEKDDVAGWIDLSNPTTPKLQALLEACDPVLKDNDAHPKAWKLDNPNFSTRFDVLDAGIVEHVRSKLAKGGFVPLERVRAELRPGSFVKPDEYNPAPNTFGILIVVFPTTHEGGTLHLRRKDNEFKYIAFYNAVEHELSPITSGYRVSLTYNLYYDDPPLPTGPLRGDGVTEEEAKLRQTLAALLENLDFLPDGGYLGFGLRYQYPIKAESSDLGSLVGALKGSDAVIKRVADELNMNAQLKLVYDDDEEEEDWGEGVVVGEAVMSYDEEEEDSDEEGEEGSGTRRILLDDANQYPESVFEDDDPLKVSVASSGGVILCKPDEKVKPFKDSTGRPVNPRKVYWVTPLTKYSRVKSAFATYGNHGSVGYAYGDLCLMVERGRSVVDVLTWYLVGTWGLGGQLRAAFNTGSLVGNRRTKGEYDDRFTKGELGRLNSISCAAKYSSAPCEYWFNVAFSLLLRRNHRNTKPKTKSAATPAMPPAMVLVSSSNFSTSLGLGVWVRVGWVSMDPVVVNPPVVALVSVVELSVLTAAITWIELEVSMDPLAVVVVLLDMAELSVLTAAVTWVVKMVEMKLKWKRLTPLCIL
ncbi:hypothetical protein K443DRAFT_121150 [Laccaria amethystina LaAM-08-1]|uniref:Prolyl 4-hydroxylase alpha subunit Fe(2+) 2OG dioxygenase domain-containing protein n=1 Tax=Laccaria amethystina LaAM-08-1 TaxID=1095629 RepID=A0A0C9Y221_9AGAR|nr:hypothetical protein K443DRAFT_121150 [Laccaria amethystina LaAM-08-1]